MLPLNEHPVTVGFRSSTDGKGDGPGVYCERHGTRLRGAKTDDHARELVKAIEK